MEYRAILFHKQATSARLRFLRFSHGSVCAFESIPATARARTDVQHDLLLHPAPVVNRLERELGFETGSLHAEEGYRYTVEAADQQIQVLLVSIDSMDPPFEQAHRIGADFIDLTQARGLPGIELDLLRGAYELVLGG